MPEEEEGPAFGYVHSLEQTRAVMARVPPGKRLELFVDDTVPAEEYLKIEDAVALAQEHMEVTFLRRRPADKLEPRVVYRVVSSVEDVDAIPPLEPYQVLLVRVVDGLPYEVDNRIKVRATIRGALVLDSNKPRSGLDELLRNVLSKTGIVYTLAVALELGWNFGRFLVRRR